MNLLCAPGLDCLTTYLACNNRKRPTADIQLRKHHWHTHTYIYIYIYMTLQPHTKRHISWMSSKPDTKLHTFLLLTQTNGPLRPDAYSWGSTFELIPRDWLPWEFVAFLSHFREQQPHSNYAAVYAVQSLPVSLFTRPLLRELLKLQPRSCKQLCLAIPGDRHKDGCKIIKIYI